MSRKNPGIAAVLAFFVPGAGFIYCERIFNGILAFIIWITFIILGFTTFSIDPRNIFILWGIAFLIWIGGIYGSYKTAKGINWEIDNPEPEKPKEEIKPNQNETPSL